MNLLVVRPSKTSCVPRYFFPGGMSSGVLTVVLVRDDVPVLTVSEGHKRFLEKDDENFK